MIWTKDRILAELKRLKRARTDMSYNRLSRTHQSLLSATTYHFGSYRQAVEAAGIQYDGITRRPRWTRENVVDLIRQAHRKKQNLNWSAVTRRGDELSRAAFASIQPRLFGRWDAALEAAGLDVAKISPYRTWDNEQIVQAIKKRQAAGEPMNSGTVQKMAPSLHAAAVRYFGGYEAALRAAGLNPDATRSRRRWDEATVKRELRRLKNEGAHISDPAIRREHPALYGACIRLFGTFTKAREAAGIER